MIANSDKHYFLFNKPTGCVTANCDPSHKTVMDYFSGLNISGLHAVGRLDKDTSGLLIITNDGAFNQRLMHPSHHVAKTYEFNALGNLDTSKLNEVSSGILLTGSDKPTKACDIEVLSVTTLIELVSTLGPNSISNYNQIKNNRPDTPVTHGKIILTEGRNHQVKRLVKFAGGYVITLKRTMIGNLAIPADLAPGMFKELSPSELELLL